MHRRSWLQTLAAGGAGLAAVAGRPTFAADASSTPSPAKFHFSLNTSTIRGQKLSLIEMIDIAAKAGYDAVEPWHMELDEYVKNGGSLPDLRKRIEGHGLVVANIIAFPEWVVDDDGKRAQGMDSVKRLMDLALQIGCPRVAAPPAGATKGDPLDLTKAAERYRAVLEIGDQMGVLPLLEFWGSSRNLSRLAEATFVALDARHPKASILADIYHLFKGGSDYAGLRLLNGDALPVIHLNDFPGNRPRQEINDAERVYPGDGVAPLKEVFSTLRTIGFRGYLSLELFNREYWRLDPLLVAQTGLEKARVILQSTA
jgi:sugar phosphate isomerase/epimerase